jgi:hypothetical protein
MTHQSSEVCARQATLFECHAKGGSNVMLDSLKPSEAGDQSSARKSYRCYFTNAEDRIQSYKVIECPTDAEAALKAQELLAASHLMTAELWQGGRLVGKWSSSGGGTPEKDDCK